MKKHPSYNIENWTKWRTVYEGGDAFIEKYLERFSERESPKDFKQRKKISYCPAYAKGAINDIKNAIFQRTVDVTRKDGTITYHKAVSGNLGGVDRQNSSMNEFIGQTILPDLLSIQKIGVWVDNVNDPDIYLAGSPEKHPYLYSYQAEDILNWTYTKEILSAIMLRNSYYIYDELGLPEGEKIQYRYASLIEDGVRVVEYDEEENIISDVILNLQKIPFVIFDLGQSLMADVANHQIALLNMASSDLSYSLKSNYPFYVEQHDGRMGIKHLIQGEDEEGGDEETASDTNIKVGVAQGRRYSKGTERPAFIHPSPEPLEVSMKKQDRIEKEIRTLVSLAVANLNPRASAESKSFDERGLEAGLSYIGLVLQKGERQIAKIWADYEKKKTDPTVNYPEKYSLKTDTQRNENAKAMKETRASVPSITFQREVTKEIACEVLGSKVTQNNLDKIYQEIDKAKILVIDSEGMHQDIEDGLITRETASKAKLYPEAEAEKAKQEHAERIARIQKAQSTPNPSARGLNDLDSEPTNSKLEKKDAKSQTV